MGPCMGSGLLVEILLLWSARKLARLVASNYLRTKRTLRNRTQDSCLSCQILSSFLAQSINI